jgi:hypothetical protein
VTGKRIEKAAACLRNLSDGSLERFLIGLRRLTVSADLSHELQRGGVQLFGGCRERPRPS